MRRDIILNEEQLKDCVHFQKKVMELFGEFHSKHNDQESFDIFSIGLTVLVSNVLASLGIKNIDHYLDHLFETVKELHKTIQKNSKGVMEYKNGVKINEGMIN
jgi:hypothetical protein